MYHLSMKLSDKFDPNQIREQKKVNKGQESGYLSPLLEGFWKV